jgi:hypothetical protein
MEPKAANVQPTPENDIVQQLQQENAALRAELQALRSTAQTAASRPTTRADHEQTFDFLNLPRELRNKVYEFCVVVGEVRIGDAEWDQHPDMRYKHPKSAKVEFPLVTVNKQVRLEVLEVYLSKNHFVAPNAIMWSSDSSRTECSPIPGCSELSLVHKHLRSLSIPFDFRSITEESNGEDSINFHNDMDTLYEVDSVMDRHDKYAYMLHSNSLEALVHILWDHQQLRRLQINVQNATCRLECHRLVVAMFNDEYIKNQLGSWVSEATTNRIESFDSLGTINDEERRVIVSAFPSSLRSKITFHGRFDPDSLEWDPEFEVLDETPSEHDAPTSSSSVNSSSG